MLARLGTRTRLLLVAGAMVLATAGCITPSAGPSGCGGPPGPPDALSASVLARTNADRAANGLGPLAWNPALWCLASQWSSQMAATGAFGHRDVGATLHSSGFRSYRTLGENIAHGPGETTGDQFEDAWLASPSHLANILSGAYSSIGIASAVAPDGSVYVTVNFGG